MPALDDVLAQKLFHLKKISQYRSLQLTESAEGAVLKRNGQVAVDFSSNDYLGLRKNNAVKQAALEALHDAAGAGASRMVSGNHHYYAPFEHALAETCQKQAALVVGSGYLANCGVIPALAGRGDMILADKFSHASMLDGAKLSGADLYRFAHNNVAHAEMLLEAHRHEHVHCLLITESIFSMDGDAAPLAALKQLAEKYDAWLLVDTAHSLYEKKTALPGDVIVGTLSKALGCYGGYIAGSQVLVDALVNTMRSAIFSTALPASIIAAATKALALAQAEPERAERALENAARFSHILELEYPVSAIIPVIFGDNKKALHASATLLEQGFYVPAIRPPAVPENRSRLRFTFTSEHEISDVEKVAKAVKRLL